MKIIISAGGTGGHIYPALAVAKTFRNNDPNTQILYVGTSNRMEKDIVPKEGFKFVGLNVLGLYRKLSLKNIKSMYLFLKAVKKSKKIIKDFKPDAVISFGGYVTAPVMYAAHKLGVKTFIHEQNSTFGVTNKFASNFADKIFVSFESSVDKLDDDVKKKCIYTGNPCADAAKTVTPYKKEELGLTPGKKLVLIVMGSLGSKTVNEKMKKILTLYNNKDYEVLFVTGKNYYEEYKNLKYTNNIKIMPYVDNMVRLLSKVDCFITRAGASTLSEICALKVPSILIPSPYVTENHQYKNAMDLVNKDAAMIIEEKDIKGDELLRMSEKILDDKLYANKLKNNLASFKTGNAKDMIYDEVVKMVNKSE